MAPAYTGAIMRVIGFVVILLAVAAVIVALVSLVGRF
jgi:hypothetical protein